MRLSLRALTLASAAAASFVGMPGALSVARAQALPSVPGAAVVKPGVGGLNGAVSGTVQTAVGVVSNSARTLRLSAPLSLPALPGTARVSRAIDATLVSPVTGDTIAITVFEPAGFVEGNSYPLVLHGHGFGLSRLPSQGPSADTPGTSDLNVAQGVADLVANGYGVISIDQRGHGQSSGAVRVMDPDVEGQNLIAVLDWAEANLPWLMYRASGSDPRNLVVGSVGGSYGGMYQLLLAHIDPKRRLDAIVPEIAPHSLPYSLAPANVPKSLWSLALFGLGTTAGRQTGSTFDPFVLREFPSALSNNRFSPDLLDFAAYHSTSYWCGTQRVATNGGPTTRPGYAPNRRVRINALFVQGMRDTLFNFNNAWLNHQCLSSRGGDVRLITTQAGHNTIPVVPDTDILRFQDPVDMTLGQCGRLSTLQARRAFLDEHLKGIKGAADIVPRDVCVSLTAQDAVLLSPQALRSAGTPMVVPPTVVTAGQAGPATVIGLGDAMPAPGRVLAGIPTVDLTLKASGPGVAPTAGSEPIVFVGVGVVRSDGQVELVDNQITPLRGLGRHQVALAGVGQRLATGQRLALLVYGAHEQYAINGGVSLRASNLALMGVSLEGSAHMPLHEADLKAP